jgi:epsilon-lactone hydrolase
MSIRPGVVRAGLRSCRPPYGGIAGLPPIVMQSAGDDPLSIDADKIEKLCAAEILDHRRFEKLWHIFHLQAGVLAEADEAIADLGARLRTHTTEGKVATK